MKVCNSCGYKNEDNAQYCVFCGQELIEKNNKFDNNAGIAEDNFGEKKPNRPGFDPNNTRFSNINSNNNNTYRPYNSYSESNPNQYRNANGTYNEQMRNEKSYFATGFLLGLFTGWFIGLIICLIIGKDKRKIFNGYGVGVATGIGAIILIVVIFVLYMFNAPAEDISDIFFNYAFR